MANIIDYVKYYKNKDFSEVPFSEVDALILCCLTYLNFDSFINLPMTIKELSLDYLVKVKPSNFKEQVNQGKLYRDCYSLFKAISSSDRFKDINITDYKKYVDSESQFGAMTFRCKHFTYIAFEGTNNYISGWKEDFYLSYKFPVQAHILAKEYINNNIKIFDKNVYIGGHSKGANLAVVGSMLSNIKNKHRIKCIYDFDGPGLRESEFNSINYESIKYKIKKYVPSQSVVGMLMYYGDIYKTVKSTSIGIIQHDPFTWQCFGSFFNEDLLSKKSIVFSKDIKMFMKEYPDDLEGFVDIIFNMFKEAGIERTSVISLIQIAKCTKYIKDLKADEKTKEKARKLIGIIIKYANIQL